jgi:preprotein translocase subunit SecE
LLSAVGAGVLLLGGAAWLWRELEVLRSENAIYIRAGIVVGLLVALGGLVWWVFNKPRVVDFMIATESEMKKVNWPSRREIIGSTWIVICGTLLIAFLLFAVDMLFARLFSGIGILEGL